MNRKKITSLLFTITLVCSLLTGCRNETDGNKVDMKNEMDYKVTLESLKVELNEQRREDVNRPLVHTTDEFPLPCLTEPADFSTKENEKYSTWVHYQNKITRKEALEDIDELMRLLKTSYGGYAYFGGDKAFEEARQRMIRRVNETYSDEMSISYPFYLIVKEEMAFIEDSHLRIGRSDSYFKKKDVFYDAEKYNFVQNEKGFYTVIDQKKWYVKPHDEKKLHLTVSDTGELVYGFFILTEDVSTLPTCITLLSEEGEERNITTTWIINKVGPDTYHKDDIHDYYVKDGIPVTSLTRMSLGFHDIDMTNDFIDKAKELKDKDVFILDLRDNEGGINEIADFFLYNLTGSRCDGKWQMAKRYSVMNKNLDEVVKSKKELYDYSGIHFYRENKELADSWIDEMICGDRRIDGETVLVDNHAKWNPYDHTIIVLINQNTMDAAEYFLLKLTTVSNVIIIGNKSNGCFVTDNYIDAADIYLYNSGNPINYSPTLVVHDRMDGFDTNGFQPDIYTRGDALEAAIAVLKQK